MEDSGAGSQCTSHGKLPWVLLLSATTWAAADTLAQGDQRRGLSKARAATQSPALFCVQIAMPRLEDATRPLRLLLEWDPPPAQASPATQASQAELDALLAASAAGSMCRARAAIRPHFCHADLMAAMARACLAGHTRVSSLLLCRTHQLPMLEAGQAGSLPDLDGTLAATVRCFQADGGLAEAGGWGGWGADHLYRALELGLQQTAAALFDSGAQLPEPQALLGGSMLLPGVEGCSCLHVLAESTHAWGRPELTLLARRLAAMGVSLTVLDSQGRTPLMVACQHRFCRTRGRWCSSDGLDLLLALSSPRSTAVGSVMQQAAREGDFRAVAVLARSGGTDGGAVQAALQAAALASLCCAHVAALRLCGAAVPAQGVEHHAQLRGALSLDTAGLLMRFGCTFHPTALLRILGASPVTGASLAAAAAAAATPEARAAAWPTAEDARLAALHTQAVVACEVRPFLLCMHHLSSADGGAALPQRQRQSCSNQHEQTRLPFPPLPDSAVELVCVLLILHSHLLY